MKKVGSTVPHTVHEIKAIMSTMEKGEEYAKVRRSYHNQHSTVFLMKRTDLRETIDSSEKKPK